MKITDVQYTPASREDRRTGLLGYVTCKLDGRLQLDGLAVRSTTDGRRTVSFPAKLDGAGVQRFFYRPLDDETRRSIERQILRALGHREGNQR